MKKKTNTKWVKKGLKGGNNKMRKTSDVFKVTVSPAARQRIEAIQERNNQTSKSIKEQYQRINQNIKK